MGLAINFDTVNMEGGFPKFLGVSSINVLVIIVIIDIYSNTVKTLPDTIWV